MKSRRALLASGLLLLLAGCRAQAWRDYYFTDPVEYYFSYPTTTDLGGAPALFIALLGEGRGPLDCIELFQQFAEDRFYALLCPDLGGKEGLADRVQAERDLADVLTDLYTQYDFESKFFLTGFGDGGEFALEYGLKYPGSVSGISAMSVDSYPETFGATGTMPVQILVGGSDTDRLAAAQETEEAWRARGVLVRLLTVAGDGGAPNQAFARLASEVIDQFDN
jgi:pimeloyl-ACP methyl ester carboxylesterase